VRLYLPAVILLYLTVALFAPTKTYVAFMGSIKLFLAILPAFLVAIALNYLLLTIKSEKASFSNKGAWMSAVVGGALSVGPIYAWYPLLGVMRQRGLWRDEHVAAFLYARAVKLPLIPLMAHFFGVPYALLFNAFLLLLSPIAGWLTTQLMRLIR